MGTKYTPETDRVVSGIHAREGLRGFKMPEDWDDMRELARKLECQRDEVIFVLRRYMAAYPAFRIKPMGAEGSPTRIEQENLMALEDAASDALRKARA